MDDLRFENCTDLPKDISTFDFTKQSWRDDVTFVLDGRRLYASKCVLAIFSPVFESMFGTDFKEKTKNEIDLSGKQFEDFLEFLHCVYPTSNRTVTRENVFQVLPLADEYQVTQLLEKCKSVLKKYIADSGNKLSINEILKCFNLATRHSLSEVDLMCVEKLVNEDSYSNIFPEAERMMDEDTLLKLNTDIFAQQAQRTIDVDTKHVVWFQEAAGINLSGFQNARGTVIEHTIENVYDPALTNAVQSIPAKLWDVRFTVKVSVVNKVINGQCEKYLSVYLYCSLPDENLECEVNAVFVLQHVSAVQNRIITVTSFSKQYRSPDSLKYGYKHFKRLSKFLTKESNDIENYTGKLVVYILANKPEVMKSKVLAEDDQM